MPGEHCATSMIMPEGIGAVLAWDGSCADTELTPSWLPAGERPPSRQPNAALGSNLRIEATHDRLQMITEDLENLDSVIPRFDPS